MEARLGCVPFLNARPLVWAFEQNPELGVSVEYCWPSQLPRYLTSGQCQAVLISSVDALTQPGRKIACGSSVSSWNSVRSVKILSKVPLGEIETLALDRSSMTSNALAHIILKEFYGIRPESIQMDPDSNAMLQEFDACVLIGDKGLMVNEHGLNALDLGIAWNTLTNLPFVWACWVGQEDLTPELVGMLNWAQNVGSRNLSAAAMEFEPSIPITVGLPYLTEVFDYGLGEKQLLALECFAEYLKKHDLVIDAAMPELVQSSASQSLSGFEIAHN